MKPTADHDEPSRVDPDNEDKHNEVDDHPPPGLKLSPDSPGYPRCLYHLETPPSLMVSGPLPNHRAVAIVGSRGATPRYRALAFQLAYHLARAGVTVVSGGAVGVDRAAHEGALHAGGATWLVSPAGHGIISPRQNRDLFKTIGWSKTSRIVWPFEEMKRKTKTSPRVRNRVLVGLTECVVVVQAGDRSGSLNAATEARTLDRPIWIVPGQPNDPAFQGSMEIGMKGGAELFWSLEWFFHKLNLPPPNLEDLEARYCGILPLRTRIPHRRQLQLTYGKPPGAKVDPTTWSDEEHAVFSVLSINPTQQDTVIQRAGLGASSTVTALLTLSLKDVVVEGPDGFFRRRVSA